MSLFDSDSPSPSVPHQLLLMRMRVACGLPLLVMVTACSREELDHFNRIMTSALGGLDPRTIEAGAVSKLPLLFSELLVVAKTVEPLDKAIRELGGFAIISVIHTIYRLG